MNWETTRLPSFSGGTIIRHIGINKETFYCRVLTGSWDDATPVCDELGPYYTYEEAMIALVDYGSRLLERDRAVIEERRRFIREDAKRLAEAIEKISALLENGIPIAEAKKMLLSKD
jgi:hypothetical protein